ncbi:MAG: carboxypeptidase-like regulatory domain-containing protein [Armatimonadetes bacterium]|jgi:hypothetical protein|nr:carboxypeptidase-like regulatory domain-containing protein [Armatimonadota bacterium]
MLYVTVRVVDPSGRPKEYSRVSVKTPGFLGGWMAEVRTDADGEAEFELNIGASDRIEVYADGQILYEDYPKSRITVTVR